MGNVTPNGGVGVLLGNGDGTFQPAVAYYSGGQDAHSVAVGDVNGDGIPDVVVTNNYIDGDAFKGGTGVLLGNGDGTFQAAVAYASGGYWSEFTAIADVNGDGRPDLLVSSQCQVNGGTANCANGVVSVLLGNGDGTFQSAVRYASGGGYAYSIATGDVNGDGKLDLLIANQCTNNSCTSASVGVLLGNGDGSFQAAQMFASGAYPDASLAVADVNGDGKPDLVVANLCVSRTNCASGGVGVLLGKGDGTFQPPVTYGSGQFNANSVVVGDVNGDGKPDIIVAKQCLGGTCANGTVGVLLGNGDGTFQPVVNYGSGGQYAYSVAVADVNGDGKPDLLVVNQCVTSSSCANGVVGVLLGNGDGTFRTAVSYGSGGQYPDSIAVADVNGDGKPDLLVANYYTGNSNSNGSLGVLLGKGDGTFQPVVSYGSGGVGDNSVAVGDVNGDGKLDLLAANQCASSNCANGALGVLLGNGDGTFQPAIVSATPVINIDFFEALALADFNGDGKLDIASGAGNFLLLGNGDGTFQSPLILGAGGPGIAVGDFNRDGKPDLAVGGVTVLLNISARNTAPTTTSLLFFAQSVQLQPSCDVHRHGDPARCGRADGRGDVHRWRGHLGHGTADERKCGAEHIGAGRGSAQHHGFLWRRLELHFEYFCIAVPDREPGNHRDSFGFERESVILESDRHVHGDGDIAVQRSLDWPCDLQARHNHPGHGGAGQRSGCL